MPNLRSDSPHQSRMGSHRPHSVMIVMHGLRREALFHRMVRTGFIDAKRLEQYIDFISLRHKKLYKDKHDQIRSNSMAQSSHCRKVHPIQTHRSSPRFHRVLPAVGRRNTLPRLLEECSER